MNSGGILSKILLAVFVLILIPSFVYLGYMLYLQNKVHEEDKKNDIVEVLTFKSTTIGVEFQYKEGSVVTENATKNTAEVDSNLIFTNDPIQINVYSELQVRAKEKLVPSELLKDIDLNGEKYTFTEYKIIEAGEICSSTTGANTHYLKTKEGLLIRATLPVRPNCAPGELPPVEIEATIRKVQDIIRTVKVTQVEAINFCNTNDLQIKVNTKDVTCTQNDAQTLVVNKQGVTVSVSKQGSVPTCASIKSQLTATANDVCSRPENNMKDPVSKQSLCDASKAEAAKTCSETPYITGDNYKIGIISLNNKIYMLLGTFTQNSAFTSIRYTDMENSSISAEDKAIVMEIMAGIEF